MTAHDAAAALAKSWRTIIRMIEREELVARMCQGEFGPQWYIDPASKPALWLACGHAAPVPAIAGDPLVGLTARKRQGILDRHQVVKAFEDSLAERPDGYGKAQWARVWVEAWNARHPDRRLCVATLYAWRRAVADAGLAGLADQRGGFAKTDIDPDLWRMFTGLYLRGAGMKLRHCYDLVAAEADGRAWPSLRTIQRRVESDIAPILKAAAHRPKEFEDRFVPYVRRDWSLVPAME